MPLYGNKYARPGRLCKSTTDENIEAVKKIIFNNGRITTRVTADDVAISFGLRQAIFMDVVGMKYAAANIVPELLHFEQSRDVDDVQL